jgi:hypothetical protein
MKTLDRFTAKGSYTWNITWNILGKYCSVKLET